MPKRNTASGAAKNISDMTEAAQTSSEPVKPWATLGALQTAGFANLVQFNSAFARTVGEIGVETASFLADRVREDIKTQQALLECSDIADVQDVQRKFFERAVEDYQAQGKKVVEIGTKAIAREDNVA